MLPKWHILFGAIFSLIFYKISPQINIFQASLIFLSSVLIDFDHYLWVIKRKGYFNLKTAYYWHKSLPLRHKPIMEIFHTIEFIIFILILSYFFKIFYFILVGMLFHSLLDLIEIIYHKRGKCREFSLIRFLILRKKYPNRYFK